MSWQRCPACDGYGTRPHRTKAGKVVKCKPCGGFGALVVINPASSIFGPWWQIPTPSPWLPYVGDPVSPFPGTTTVPGTITWRSIDGNGNAGFVVPPGGIVATGGTYYLTDEALANQLAAGQS